MFESRSGNNSIELNDGTRDGIVLLDSLRVFFSKSPRKGKNIYIKKNAVTHPPMPRRFRATRKELTAQPPPSSISEFLNTEFLSDLDAHFSYLKSISGTLGQF